MPAPISNRESLIETAKALWIHGLKIQEIQAKTGVNTRTLRTWNLRYRWNELKQSISTELNKSIVKTVQDGLERRSSEARNNLATEIEDSIAKLNKNPPKSVKELIRGRAATVKQIADTAEKVFGWQNQADNDVRLGVMVNLTLDARTDQTPQEPVIEVESKPA